MGAILVEINRSALATMHHHSGRQRWVGSYWFTNCAEEAVSFYVSAFNNSRVQRTARYGDAGSDEPGKVMTIELQPEWRDVLAINGDMEIWTCPMTEKGYGAPDALARMEGVPTGGGHHRVSSL